MSSASPMKRTTQGCATSSSQSCNFSCPNGGTWFTCPDIPHFIGCCASDPCSNTILQIACPDLHPASFNPDIYGLILPNDCLNNASNNNWYTCSDTDPPFLGCCRSNPCKEGVCPPTDLIPAAWSNQQQQQIFLDAPTPSTPQSVATSLSIANESVATSSSIASESVTTSSSITSESERPTDSTIIMNSSVGSQENFRLSTGAIAGISVGVIIVTLTIVSLIAILMYYRGWHARRRSEGLIPIGIEHQPMPRMTDKGRNPQVSQYGGLSPSHSSNPSPIPPSGSPSSIVPYMSMSAPEDNGISHEGSIGYIHQPGPSPDGLPFASNAHELEA